MLSFISSYSIIYIIQKLLSEQFPHSCEHIFLNVSLFYLIFIYNKDKTRYHLYCQPKEQLQRRIVEAL